MPPTIQFSEGLFRAEMGLASNRPIDMEPMLGILEESRNPNFERISRAIGGKVAKTRMKFEWRRLDQQPFTCKVTAATAIGGATISVDHPEWIHQDQLLFNTNTNELYLANFTTGVAPAGAVAVLSYPAAGTLVTATSIGDVIVIGPEAHAEGEEVPPAYHSVPTDAFDYIMQIDRRGAHITDIAMNEAEYDPRGQRDIDNKMSMIELMKGLNLLFYISQSTRETTSASGPRRHAMGGLRQKITTNRISLAGVPSGLTPALMGEIMRKTVYQGGASSTKMCMIGQYASAAISAMPANLVRLVPTSESYGLNINEIITPHGNCKLSYDPVLTEEFGLADIMVCLDMATVRQTYLQNMGLQLVQKVQNLTTLHQIVDAVTLTAGLQVKNEELNAWVEDIH